MKVPVDEKIIFNYVKPYIQKQNINDDYTEHLKYKDKKIVIKSNYTTKENKRLSRTYNIMYYSKDVSHMFYIIRIKHFLGLDKEVILPGALQIYFDNGNEVDGVDGLNIQHYSQNFIEDVFNLDSDTIFLATLCLNNCLLQLTVNVDSDEYQNYHKTLVINNVNFVYVTRKKNQFILTGNDIIKELKNIDNKYVQKFRKYALLFIKPIKYFDKNDKKMLKSIYENVPYIHEQYESIYLPIVKTKSSNAYLSNLYGKVCITGKSNKSLALLAKSKLLNEYNIKTFNNNEHYTRFDMNPYVVFYSEKKTYVFKKFWNSYIRIENEECQKVINQFNIICKLSER